MQAAAGDPLFLTPYIESGDLEGGRAAAKVDSSALQGMDEQVESYSGFLTVDKPNNGNMFFWFFPAEEAPETAPVVIWLQVGAQPVRITDEERFPTFLSSQLA